MPVRVNDEDVTLEPAAALLWALRDQLGLLGAKFGCGLEQCGACAVLVDGVAGPSCRTAVAEVGGRAVTTIEGLRATPSGQRILAALIGANAAQCGYCLPGIVVALAPLAARATVGWEDVLRALEDHICRCGSHPRILRVAASLFNLAPFAPVVADGDGRPPEPCGADAPDTRRLLGSLVERPGVDQWVDFEEPGIVRIRTGKVELGQGIRTAITLMAAEELGLDPGRVEVQRATTAAGPDEGFTAGSRSVEQSGVAVRQACAHVRLALLARAAERLGIPVHALETADGAVVAPDGTALSYWDLAAAGPFRIEVTEPVPTHRGPTRTVVGRPGARRVDLAAKIAGDGAYVGDLRLDGMRFARVVRPRRRGAELVSVPEDVAGIPGATVVRRGSFLAVVAETEGAAALAADALGRQVEWAGGAPFPPDPADVGYMQAHVVGSYAVRDGRASDLDPGSPPDPGAGGSSVIGARYTKQFLLHASIGPSSAVAQLRDGMLTVWTHSQGIGHLRRSLAALVDMPDERVVVHHHDGPGCYGHNGADDAAADAALVATAIPGPPVLVRWSREDEHANEPLGPAMVVELRAGTSPTGDVQTWCEEIWTYRHNSRPVLQPSGTRLLPGWSLDPPVPRARATAALAYEVGGHRNATPLYDVGTRWIVKHDVDDGSPLRTSSLRGLGAPANVFAIESFMEELAEAAGRDPVEYRLAHLHDDRGHAVIEAALAMAGGLEAAGGLDAPGRGLGFARYENSMAYVAVVVELDADPRSGAVHLRQAWLAADAGEVIDPDGLVNQLEGGFVQAASWALTEEVTFDADGVAGRDWEGYEVIGWHAIPRIATRLLDRPDCPPLGAGEASCGPAVAAIANALRQLTGVRLRDLPFTPARVRSGFSALL